MAGNEHGVGLRRALAVAVLGGLMVTGVAVSGASAASRPTVTIGVIAPVDGGLTAFGRGIRNSVQLAVKEAAAKHQVSGWNVEVRVLDDSSDPTKGQQAAETLAKDKSVVAVVGPYNSGVAQTAAPVLAAKGIALVSPSNTLTSLTVGSDPTAPERQWKSYFRLVGPDSRQAEFLAKQAGSQGFEKAAVVSETKAVSQGLADEFVAAFEKQGGQVAVQQTVPDAATAPDFAGFITAATAAAPDVVFFGGEYNVAAVLRDAATASGLTAPMMGGDGMNDAAFTTGAGAAASGSFASGVGIPLAKLPGSAAFLAAYGKAGYTDPPSDYGPYAYDAANIVLDALAKELRGKTSLPSGIRAAVMRDVQKTKGKFLTGTVAFDRYGDVTHPTFTLYTVTGTPLAWTTLGSS